MSAAAVSTPSMSAAATVSAATTMSECVGESLLAQQ
jgi:hypothetical protein